ncbi:MAG: succinyl-CoA synthetase alpha subunit [Congregibacter sp.]|jgi:succinyl-CoA synthetase alpha subunit
MAALDTEGAIIAGHIYRPSKVGILFRYGILTNEAVKQTTDEGFG